MAYDYKVLGIKDVPLIDLVIGKGQMRKTHVAKEIHELADNINVVGQIHPIVVCPSSEQPGKYEILTGQRRFLACKELGRDSIQAKILDRPVPETEAKVLSLSENLMILAPDKSDYIDLCTHLFNIYADMKIVAKKTGLPVDKVRQYVKYATLSPELKQLVDKGAGSGGVDMKTALRVQTALEKTGEVNPDIAVALANKMKGMIGVQQEKMAKEVAKGSITTIGEVEKVAEAAKKGKDNIRLVINLDIETDTALTTYAKEEGMMREDAAQSLIREGLGAIGAHKEDE